MDVNECSYEQSYDDGQSALLQRVEIRTRPDRRLRWISAVKRSTHHETLSTGATAQAVADRHGIGTGLIYTWRKQTLRAAMASFAAVQIKPEMRLALYGLVAPAVALPLPPRPPSEPSAPPPAIASPSTMPGGIEVELPSVVRLRFGSDVDGPALQRILAAMAVP